MDQGFTDMRQHLVADGRMHGYAPMERVWPERPRRRLRPTAVHRRSDVTVSAEAVIVSGANTGLMVLIGQLADTADTAAFTQWHEQDYIPALLETGLFRGSVRYVSDAPDLAGAYALICYTDADAPDAAFTEFLKMSSATDAKAAALPTAPHSNRRVFSGIFRPSMGHYEHYA